MAKLKATIDRIEGEKAVIILDGGQSIVIEKKLLGFAVLAGQVIEIDFQLADQETKAKEAKAKKLLSQLNQDEK